MRKFNSQKIPQPILKNPSPSISPDHYWELEIGCGNGEFSLNRASQYPDKNIIAIEKTRNKISKIPKVIPKNLWVIHTNAVWWVTHYVPPHSLDKVFILYPNVYKKSKQANLRWINRPFFEFLLERIKVDGEIEFRTNELFYIQEVKEKMSQEFSFMECIQDKTITQNPQTAFERKYLAQTDCFSLKFIKKVL